MLLHARALHELVQPSFSICLPATQQRLQVSIVELGEFWFDDLSVLNFGGVLL